MLSEQTIINLIRKIVPSKSGRVIAGIGDDTAVIDLGNNKVLLLTIDPFIEDTHFKREWASFYEIGAKALAINVSDIAAMGGIPLYALVSLALPKHFSLSAIKQIYSGINAIAKKYGVAIVGGDVSAASKLSITISLAGEAEKKEAVLRSGAKPGDLIFVSGDLGEAALGLKLLQKYGRKKEYESTIKKHVLPKPQVELGRALAKFHFATSMIDNSDGLAKSIRLICEESKVSAEIYDDKLPISKAFLRAAKDLNLDPLKLIFSGGEDYCLVFTVKSPNAQKAMALAKSLKLEVSCVGKITKGKFRKVALHGFDHLSE